MKERDCTNCKHHTSGGCSSWDCEFEAIDTISRADAIAYIDRVTNSGLGRNKSLDYIHKYISSLPPAETYEIRTETHECVKETHDTDLISRTDAIRIVDSYIGTDHISDRIKLLPSSDAEWIPCSDRLPSEERHYLCCNKGYLPFIADYYGGQWYDFEREISRVDAWMPLPKPYKGGDIE